jgi:hypothetical protein
MFLQLFVKANAGKKKASIEVRSFSQTLKRICTFDKSFKDKDTESKTHGFSLPEIFDTQNHD